MVDDETDVAALFSQHFRHEVRQGQYVLHFANSATEALQKLERGIEPQLIVILSDINMPEMDGLSLLHEIKQWWPDLPVIMVTAYGDDDRRQRARDYGAADFIAKPVDFGFLKKELQQLSQAAAPALPPADPGINILQHLNAFEYSFIRDGVTAELEQMQISNDSILLEARRIARPYWFSEERWLARSLLAAILAMNLGQVYINVRINSWQNDFYNSLQEYDRVQFLYQLGLFALLAGASVALLVYGAYLQQMLQIRWRRWMTNVYLKQWLDSKTYYHLQLTDGETDNPDQRIAEDLKLFPGQTLELSLGLLTNGVQAASFSFILWRLSGPLVWDLGHLGSLSLPGYMFWAVVAYTAIATWIAIRLGRPLINLNFARQRFEADFRFSLVRLRENAESVALYGGEAYELSIFSDRFRKIFEHFCAIMLRTRILGLAQNGSSQAAVIFPYIIVAPRYFGQHLKLGGIQQVADAFVQLQGSLAYIINSYNDIASWAAVVRRLASFRGRVNEIQAEMRGLQPIRIERAGEGLSIISLSLELPNGRVLREDSNLEVPSGKGLLIKGESGSGKSTLLRAIAGLWPFGQGYIRLDPKRAYFVPQKPYIPLGSLREALLYPDAGDEVRSERLSDVLQKVGLSHLRPELDTIDVWAQRLSGGEQQRLALARVLLAQPATIFLDEATASLDEAAEASLYGLLRGLAWHPTVISIGHRSTLSRFHDRLFELSARQPI